MHLQADEELGKFLEDVSDVKDLPHSLMRFFFFLFMSPKMSDLDHTLTCVRPKFVTRKVFSRQTPHVSLGLTGAQLYYCSSLSLL